MMLKPKEMMMIQMVGSIFFPLPLTNDSNFEQKFHMFLSIRFVFLSINGLILMQFCDNLIIFVFEFVFMHKFRISCVGVDDRNWCEKCER